MSQIVLSKDLSIEKFDDIITQSTARFTTGIKRWSFSRSNTGRVS